MSFEINDNDDVMNEINMTPLVDVMLVLLIIFIITIPVVQHAVKVELEPGEVGVPEWENDARPGLSDSRRADAAFFAWSGHGVALLIPQGTSRTLDALAPVTNTRLNRGGREGLP